MDWMLMPMRRYADFEGRSRRKEYWMFALGTVIVAMIIAVLIGVTAGFDADGAPSGIGLVLLVVFVLGLAIPSLAVQVRRFHDQDRSGWMVLLGLIPYAGGFIVLVFMCLDGTRGANRFGADPKDPIGETFG